jgi:hypothetical protein
MGSKMVRWQPFIPTITNEINKSVNNFIVGAVFINPVNLSQTL